MGFKENPVTLGEHLKKARLSRGLLQKEVGSLMGISHFTYLWWERDKYLPCDKQWKLIIDFLGYYPILGSIREINPILAKRHNLGLTKKALADLLGIDEATYSRIENGKRSRGHKTSHSDLLFKIYALD